MRLLAVTMVAGLALTACASSPSTVDSGGKPAPGTAVPSGSSGQVAPGGGTGSGSAGPIGSTPASPPAGSPVDSRCPVQLDQGPYNSKQARPVPAGIDVAWVLRCSVKPQPGGAGRTLLVERSDSDPAALLAALRARDEPPTSGVCLTIRMLVPYFALIQRDGKPFVARMPLTSCRMPQAAVVKALDGLKFRVIASKPLS
jgi:hypothetical protein